jgi:hypothetical protein
MAGIFDSLNFDPLALLQARALDPSTTGSVAAPGGAVSPAPPAATPPAPVASPAATGGGGSFLGGIGTAMANILQGSGASGDIPSDAEIDPVSGIPKGIARRANNQSMMKMGMTLLMAGLSRDPGTRGKMLAALPGTMDASDTINNFAKTRLEMARTKLIERQILAEEATTARAQATYGPQGGPSGTVAAGTPVANPAGGAPAGAGPVGATPPPGAVGATPGATVADPATTGGAAPALGAAVQGGAAGVAPIPLTPEAVAGLPTKPPPAPPVPKWTPTPEERASVGLLRNTALTDFISKRTAEAASRQVETAPYKVPEMNAVMVDIYQGGQKVGSKKIGDLPSSIVESPDKRGGFTRKTVTPSGVVTGITDVAGPTKFVDTPHPTKPGTIIREKIAADGSVESRSEVMDPAVEEDRKTSTQIAVKDRDALKERYESAVRPAIDTHDRVVKLKEQLGAGNAITGTGSDIRRTVLRTMASAGFLKPDAIRDLVNTGRLEAELGRGAGEFAKKYYGPQISNADVTAANRLMGALMSNSREEIMGAIDLVLNENKNIVRAYKQDATRHNDSIPDHLTTTKSRLRADLPSKDLDAPIEKTVNGVTYVNDGQGWRVKP